MNQKAILLLFFLSMTALGISQPVYNMQNATVTDCEGVLLDSDNGPEAGQYDHNEDFTFTICVEGATEIIVSFQFFATEENYDILTVYDGPDINAPVLATLSGLIQPAPTLVATSGCITFRFVSDDNIAAIGWRATWTTEILTPPTPNLSLVSPIECPMDMANFNFDRPIDCALFESSNFTILGPGGSQVVNVIPLDCDPETQTAQNFTVFFSPALSSPANFRLLFNGFIDDACGNPQPFSTNVLFTLTNCPLSAYIQLVDGPACVGLCADLQAIVTGGPPGANYSFNWSHSPVTGAMVTICSETPGEITVTATDIATGQMVLANLLYEPLPLPSFLNPVADTVCASRGDHIYQVTPTGGEFYSSTIPDAHRTTGRYQFWRLAGQNQLTMDVIRYVAPNGCIVRDTVWVWPISAGNPQSACVDADPFNLVGGHPAGGQWSGMHVNAGIFDPTTTGTFNVTFTAANGCTATKQVRVAEEIIMPTIDSLCTNNAINLEAEPYGGRWSGLGVVNAVNGRLEPWRANFNEWNTYTYTLNGCSATMDIYINEVWAGPDRTLCTSETMLPLNTQGQWTGPGVYMPDENSFDISGLSPGRHTFRLSQNGCTDQFELNLINVSITSEDLLSFCPDAGATNIHSLINRTPGGGILSGPGVSRPPGDGWHFNPSEAGIGWHTLFYEAIGCTDSLLVYVEPYSDIPLLSFCDRKEALIITADPPGGVWSGPGFLDETIGLFDPQTLTAGLYEIEYTAPSGCKTNAEIDIFPYEQVRIENFAQQYCFRDTQYLLTLVPGGGLFTINGQTSSPDLNPSILGPGTHELLYRRGQDECASTERRFITVLEPILPLAALANDSICAGQSAVVSIEATGGRGNLQYNWSGELGFGNSQIARPASTTWYTVTVTDQCSDPLIDSLQIYVHQPFEIPISQGPEVCFENTTYLDVLLDLTDYQILWPSNVEVQNNRMTGQPGLYTISVEETFSGCIQSLPVLLPGSPPLKANFSVTPNQDCIDIINNEIEILDLSSGYSSGFFDFGDGSPNVDITQTGTIRHIYRDTGDFIITLYIANELGCVDELSRPLCVENRVRLYVPTAFTPNGDGTNDELEIFGFGIEQVRWNVYDRYGSLLFEGFDIEDKWDGTHRGQPLNPDTFLVVVEYYDQIKEKKEIYKGEVYLIK